MMDDVVKSPVKSKCRDLPNPLFLWPARDGTNRRCVHECGVEDTADTGHGVIWECRTVPESYRTDLEMTLVARDLS